MFEIMRISNTEFIACLLLALVICQVQGQSGTQIAVSVNAAEGLIYLLLVIFFLVNFCTPVGKWLYVNYLESFVDKTSKELARIQKKLSERISDAGRKVSQSIRS